MSYNVNNQLELVNYFANRANILEDQAKSAKIYDNPVDKGDVREGIVLGFLQDHLPKRCEIIRGGYVFDQFGNRSKQIDLIVTSDSTLQFKQRYSTHEIKSFNTTEGTLAAISVKSTLDKEEL
jgi:hypothetical protein